MDPVNNASEFTSRINYVATSALSLGVALDIPGQSLLTGPLLYGYASASTAIGRLADDSQCLYYYLYPVLLCLLSSVACYPILIYLQRFFNH